MEGSRCSIFIFGLLARPEHPNTRTEPNAVLVDASRQHIKTEKINITKPQPYEASASARAASSAKKTSDSRDGGRISRNEERIDAALRAAISTMGDGVLLTGSSSRPPSHARKWASTPS